MCVGAIACSHEHLAHLRAGRQVRRTAGSRAPLRKVKRWCLIKEIRHKSCCNPRNAIRTGRGCADAIAGGHSRRCVGAIFGKRKSIFRLINLRRRTSTHLCQKRGNKTATQMFILIFYSAFGVPLGPKPGLTTMTTSLASHRCLRSEAENRD